MSEQLLTEIRDLLVEANAMTKKALERQETVLGMTETSLTRSRKIFSYLKIFLVIAAVSIIAQVFLR